MASICNDPNGRRRITFTDSEGARPTIRLGKVSKRDAETVKVHVESLLSSRIAGAAMRRDDAVWLSEIDAGLRLKLEKVGLVESAEPEKPSAVQTLDEFLTGFVKRKGVGKKPATIVVWEQVTKLLRLYMPEGIRLDEVTTGHAKEFVAKLRERGLSSATVQKRVQFARQFFEDAVDWELIERNPFAKVKTKSSSKKSNVEVDAAKIAKVLKHCDTDWTTIVALSRFGGLRCPSEVLSLKWEHVDWENDRLHVPEPKVEHHEGRGIRHVPIFAELRPHLEAAFKAATVDAKYPSPESYVVSKQAYRDAAMRPGGWANANLRTQLLKILKRAGVEPWKRLFHSMRATRQTELESAGYPRHVVCAWLGNTEAVAERHYLLVSEEDFAQAAAGTKTVPEKAARNPARRTTKNGVNAAQQPARKVSQAQQKNPRKAGSNASFIVVNDEGQMEDNGLEPMTYALPARRSPN